MRKTRVIALAALALCGLGGVLALTYEPRHVSAAPAQPAQPVWTEAAWPFPMDQWGLGKAFVCKAADCGTDITLYIRAKIGFCNCTTGVADDEELDRLSDFDPFGNQLRAVAPGQPITVAWMKGRSRAFAIGRTGKSALSIGFNERCDAIIATAVLANERAAAAEKTVLEFLNSRTVLRWAEATLGR